MDFNLASYRKPSFLGRRNVSEEKEFLKYKMINLGFCF